MEPMASEELKKMDEKDVEEALRKLQQDSDNQPPENITPN